VAKATGEQALLLSGVQVCCFVLREQHSDRALHASESREGFVAGPPDAVQRNWQVQRVDQKRCHRMQLAGSRGEMATSRGSSTRGLVTRLDAARPSAITAVVGSAFQSVNALEYDSQKVSTISVTVFASAS
jgi:hypothetical protein